jgi:hypothetical protein
MFINEEKQDLPVNIMSELREKSGVHADSHKIIVENVAKCIETKGYAIATLSGIRLKSIEIEGLDDCHGGGFGVLKDKPLPGLLQPLSELLRNRFNRKRADLAAVVWFDNGAAGATRSNWKVDVFGSEHYQKMEELAQALSEKYGIGIGVRKMPEKRKETFASDHFKLFY